MHSIHIRIYTLYTHSHVYTFVWPFIPLHALKSTPHRNHSHPLFRTCPTRTNHTSDHRPIVGRLQKRATCRIYKAPHDIGTNHRSASLQLVVCYTHRLYAHKPRRPSPNEALTDAKKSKTGSCFATSSYASCTNKRLPHVRVPMRWQNLNAVVKFHLIMIILIYNIKLSFLTRKNTAKYFWRFCWIP